MRVRRSGVVAWLVLAGCGLFATACLRTTWVVVPRPNGGYRTTDTLVGYSNGKQVVVSFRFDTITHTRTLYRTDTIYRDGVKVIRDTVVRIRHEVRHDTIRVFRRDTLRIVRHDTVRLFRVDTLREVVGNGRVDTVRYAVHDTTFIQRLVPMPPVVRVDTVNHAIVDSILVTHTIVRVDTVRHVDTVFVAGQVAGGQRVDTVRIVRTDTVRLAGKRVLFVPPGQYPPEGQCRVWIADKPPGQQRDAERCDAIGDVPSGAFILFGGDAWDFDYDWIAEQQRTGRVPAQIEALKRRRP